MRQHFKLILTFLLLQFMYMQHSRAQLAVPGYVQKYFRVNPYLGKFGSFVQALKTDEDLTILKETLITDSTLYFLQGKYKTFNPFSLKNVESYIILQEYPTTDKANVSADSASLLSMENNLYHYVLVGVFDNQPGILDKVKKEYNRICKSIKRTTNKNQITTNIFPKSDEIEDGEEILINYSFQNGSYSNDYIKWELRNNNKIFLAISHIIFP